MEIHYLYLSISDKLFELLSKKMNTHTVRAISLKRRVRVSPAVSASKQSRMGRTLSCLESSPSGNCRLSASSIPYASLCAMFSGGCLSQCPRSMGTRRPGLSRNCSAKVLFVARRSSSKHFFCTSKSSACLNLCKLMVKFRLNIFIQVPLQNL